MLLISLGMESRKISPSAQSPICVSSLLERTEAREHMEFFFLPLFLIFFLFITPPLLFLSILFRFLLILILFFTLFEQVAVWDREIFFAPLKFYVQDCINNGGSGSTNNNARVIRIVKILRLLRIARILKLVKFVTWDSAVYNNLELTYLSFSQFTLFESYVLLTGIRNYCKKTPALFC